MNRSIFSRVTTALHTSRHPSLGLGKITSELNQVAAEIVAQHLAEYGFHVCDRGPSETGACLSLVNRGPGALFVEIDIALILAAGPDNHQSLRIGLRVDEVTNNAAGDLFDGYSRIKGQWYGVLSSKATYQGLISSWTKASSDRAPTHRVMPRAQLHWVMESAA